MHVSTRVCAFMDDCVCFGAEIQAKYEFEQALNTKMNAELTMLLQDQTDEFINV